MCRRSARGRSRRRLRLREGESNLLAGLLERRAAQDPDRVSRADPRSRSCDRSSARHSDEVNQTDIVMLLTPHIVRTHELTVEDLSSDLHRHAAERRPRRSAAADCAAAGRTCRTRGRRTTVRRLRSPAANRAWHTTPPATNACAGCHRPSSTAAAWNVAGAIARDARCRPRRAPPPAPGERRRPATPNPREPARLPARRLQATLVPPPDHARPDARHRRRRQALLRRSHRRRR